MAYKRFSTVAAYVRETIDQTADNQDFRDLLLHLMSRPGRVMCPCGPIKWPAFVLQTCRALGGDPAAAVPAAAAIEFIIAAADVVDDLVDDDWEQLGKQWSRSLNASLGLTWLAQQCIKDLAHYVSPERVLRINELVAQQAMISCAGEDLDLLLETEDEITAEATLEMTTKKSGALVAMACQVGAALATDDGQALSLVRELGTQIGTIAQLLNDVGGILSGTDIRRRKKTLPIAFALRCAREENIPQILDWYRKTYPLSKSEEEQLAIRMRDLGALHYGSVVAEAHRHQALATVAALQEATKREEVRELRKLVPKVWSSKAQQHTS